MSKKYIHSSKINLIDNRFILLIYNMNDGVTGRCGGGWDFNVGMQATKREACIDLHWFTIRISFFGARKHDQ
jgi:hypothetical protein